MCGLAASGTSIQNTDPRVEIKMRWFSLSTLNDGAVETFVLGKARGHDQAEEEETGEDGEKSRTHV